MAYSNTNRDKEQAGWAKRLKELVLVGFMTMIIFSSVTNIWQQGKTLSEANARTRKLSTEVGKIAFENKVLERQIEYATSSAYAERKAREYLGLGGPNDNWLKVPKDSPNYHSTAEFTEVTAVSTVLQWWNLFTK